MYPPNQQQPMMGGGDEPRLPPDAPQLELSESEMQELVKRVQDDYSTAVQVHKQRMDRVNRNLQRWRSRVGMPGGSQGKSNFAVPLIKSQVFVKWAKVVEQMLGEDAEIVAVPQGESDHKVVAKIGRYMTWLLFSAMGIANDLIEWTFQYIIHGRAIAYAPYERETFDTPDGEDVVDYEGPGFHVLAEDEFICPPENPRSLHDFTWIIRKYDATIDDLLDGEEQGIYVGISDNLEKLIEAAKARPSKGNRSQDSQITDTKDSAQGMEPGWGSGYNSKLEVREWYGYHRMLAQTEAPAVEQEPDEMEPPAEVVREREARQTELVIRILPDVSLHGQGMYIGGQKLKELYPRMKRRRPFVEISLVKDGTYWGPGLGELLETMEDELTANHNLTTEAVERSVGPIILYRPGSGFDPDTFRYDPGTAIPVEDPSAVNVVRLEADINGSIEREHTTFRWVERLTGLTDLQAGRASDRPNAPRTARQTVALMEESNIRVFLDTTVLRNDLSKMLKHFWDIDTMYGSEQVFFRVTEEQAKGLFETGKGGATITQAERAGRYDFQLDFASSVHSKEKKKENLLNLYQIHLSNPYIAQNARALWFMAKQITGTFGEDFPADVFPEPPMPMVPHTPDQEWNMLLEGEDIFVHPDDNDDDHMKQHDLQGAGQLNEPPERRDARAFMKLLAHNKEHEIQKQKKLLAAVAMKAMMGQVLQQMQGGQMGQGPQGQLGPAPQVPQEQPERDEEGELPPLGAIQ